MNEIIINPSTKQQIDALINKMPQSLLIFGDSGVGLTHIAKYIIKLKGFSSVILLPEKDEKVDLEKGVIGIEIIRRLYDETKSKRLENKMIVIDYAERMTTQAQNAFLKLLEEPNQSVYFVLLSHSIKNFLPTILSRMEKICVEKITSKQTNDFLDKLGYKDGTIKTQLIFMADGLPAEICRLVNNKEYFDIRCQNIKDAKDLILKNAYEKLLIINKYKDSKDDSIKLLIDVANILKIYIYSNKDIKLIKLLDKVIDSVDKLSNNFNIKLVLTGIFI